MICSPELSRKRESSAPAGNNKRAGDQSGSWKPAEHVRMVSAKKTDVQWPWL